ncbi:DEAD/DEAH box helicase [Nocardia sp. NRRL S-836]|uniref:DEAD/DEAH box helicase n=1 Tax=Nocardia sp. NRRL S-836 TaxID=1519492 RepID=UPI0006AFC0E2|nr:DEAD/DEAH box helicase [Nocardia sp. NRRL S-836]KOV82478.1 DEAD/DEAH box helicase [Nocardia sp. NRRL S-836]
MTHADDRAGLDTSVAGVARRLWGVEPAPAIPRYAEPGWQLSPHPIDRRCPRCAGELHGLYRVAGNVGKPRLQAAVVCPLCPASFKLSDLQLAQRAVLGELRPEAVARRLADDERLSKLAAEQRVRPSAPAHRPEPAVDHPAAAATTPVAPRPSRVERPQEEAGPQHNGKQAQTRAQSPEVDAQPPRLQGQPPQVEAQPLWPDTQPSALDDQPPHVAAQPPRAEAQPAQAEGDTRQPETQPERDPATPPRRTSTIVTAAKIRRILADADATTARDDVPVALPPAPVEPEHRLLFWCKTVDPELTVPRLPGGTDVRVVFPDENEFDELRERLGAAGVPFRAVPHWVEEEWITSVDAEDGSLAQLRVTPSLTGMAGLVAEPAAPLDGADARAARDAFELLWELHEPVDRTVAPQPVPAEELVPRDWLRFLPYSTLNPAQAQACPSIVDGDGHVVVTAPTGAGKTVIGMLAVLRSILEDGRKAAWLVPQRTLTDELDRELETWRGQGLRVERLSGEYAVDVERVRAADLWVATTEKFEAICRASSLQTALAEVGCMVVDEIHLLGSAGRGALLEALLARVRGAESPVRIVGLSATVSNASEVADWLEGELVSTTWRPSRLTWQLPMLPATSRHAEASRMREQAVAELVQRHTAEKGSVLVFCGSKPKVRSTALMIAAERGAPVHLVGPTDFDKLETVCAEVGVRLHYADWDGKHASEQAFRAREADVLVATTTVAAGVNLPARAVVVRDTKIGTEPMDTATVMQMFGRAGRVGAGETEGWAYLLTDETERAEWQRRLMAGYSVYSQIYDSLPDHVLAEVLQGRITTAVEAEEWWRQTLAFAQGDEDVEPVRDALQFLVEKDYLGQHERDGDTVLTVTELGRLTAQLMVSTYTGARLRQVLGMLPAPEDADTAEEALTCVLGVTVPELADAPVAEVNRPAVATAIRARGRTSRLTDTTAVQGLGSSASVQRGDLAWAALLLVARSPQLFTGRGRRAVAGIPLGSLYPVLEQAPRYLSWLAAQGYLGTVHPWVAIVSADLDRRVRWRACTPGRGAGRLLWMCEQMATRAHAKELVPGMWRSAIGRGVRAPDWAPGRPPAHCQLDQAAYTALLRERTTAAQLTARGDGVTITGIAGAAAVAWTGRRHTAVTITRATTELGYPVLDDDDPDAGAASGAAVFTRRGDHRATGWLAAYGQLTTSAEDAEDADKPVAKPVRRGLGRA